MTIERTFATCDGSDQRAREETESLSRRREVREEKGGRETARVSGLREGKSKKEKDRANGPSRLRADQAGGGDLEDRIAMMERKIDRQEWRC